MAIDFSPATTGIGQSVADVQAFMVTNVVALAVLSFVIAAVVWFYRKVFDKTVRGMEDGRRANKEGIPSFNMKYKNDEDYKAGYYAAYENNMNFHLDEQVSYVKKHKKDYLSGKHRF